MKVFLDGTGNDSNWRDGVIKKLNEFGIKYFDPSDTMDSATFKKKNEEKDSSDFCMYVITPKMSDFYSIVEVVDDSNKRSKHTVFCFLEKEGDSEFTKHQIKSLNAVGKMVKTNGGHWFETLDEVCSFLNDQKAVIAAEKAEKEAKEKK